MKHFSISALPVRNKTILLRVDYNVPIKDGKVLDNGRIKVSLPTIKYLLQQQCKIVVATHLGRPEGKVMPTLRVDPLAKELQKLLPKEKIIKLDDCMGKEIKERIFSGQQREIFMLENLRFYAEEEANDRMFAHSLASLAEVYINDAFANCHRAHASVHAITSFLPSAAGLLVEKELTYLHQALNPKHPAVWILGGGKLDKVDLLQQALRKADYILLGGALPFPFLKAKGIEIGMSKVDLKSVEAAKRIMSNRDAKKIIFPLDFVSALSFSAKAKKNVVFANQIPKHEIALDLGPQTIELFKRYLRKAETIVWNGPLGYYEWAAFSTATKEIGRCLGKLTATAIAGGGETTEAIEKFGLAHNFTHLSTGGGASVAYLSGQELPALKALEENYKKFKKKLGQ